MAINNALAGIAVKNLPAAMAWYEQLLDRSADSRPMEQVAEWRFDNGGWIQVFHDEKRAGSSSVTLAVTDLEELLAELKSKGVTIGRTTASKSVKTAIVTDPDGNQIVLAEALTDAIAS